jgi:hypothetical protein
MGLQHLTIDDFPTGSAFNKTTAPTVNDDTDLGYNVGCVWIDTTADKAYVCLDNTDGAAVWTETTGNVWVPPPVSLGSLWVSGASFFLNGGAGVYLSFKGTADDAAYFNDNLDNGIPYDGSDLAIKLHWRLSTDAGVGDTVGWIVEYAVIKVGDNSTTTVTTIAQQNVVVTGKLQDIDFSTQLGTMAGVVGGSTLMLTLTRNANGAGQDTFTGNAEIISIELIKV